MATPDAPWVCHGCGCAIAGRGTVLIVRRDPASGAVAGPPDPQDPCGGTGRPYEVGVYCTTACAPRSMLRGVRFAFAAPAAVEGWMSAVATVSDEPWAGAKLLSDLLRLWWTRHDYRVPVAIREPQQAA